MFFVGHVYQGRNLDFGLFLGWDSSNHTWALTERLRPLLFNAKFTKNGETVYQGVYFAGLRKGRFCLFCYFFLCVRICWFINWYEKR